MKIWDKATNNQGGRGFRRNYELVEVLKNLTSDKMVHGQMVYGF